MNPSLQRWLPRLAFASCVLLGSTAPALGTAGAASAPHGLASQSLEQVALDDGWILEEADNICGLREKRKLSNPAAVDWTALLDETPEMRRIQRDGIDPETPEGIQLRQRARERLTRHCKSEMDAQGHCSVWKTISHRDGRAITDITAAVRRRLQDESAR